MEIDKKIIKKLIETLDDLKKSLKDEDVFTSDSPTEEETQRAQEEWKDSMSDIKAEHESVIDNNERHDEQEQEEAPKIQQVKREGPKVKRNDPCPCGSGKKFKQCHGKVEG